MTARRTWAPALIVAVVVAHLAIVWSFRFFPSQDGPLHLENAAVLRQLVLHEPGVASELYAVNGHADPNWLVQVFLALVTLTAPAVTPLVAEKLVLTLYLIGLPAATAYAARASDRGAGFLAALALPILMSFPVHLGFYNFAWSLVLGLVALGFWLRRRQALRAREAVILSGLLTALYFGDPVSFAITALSLAILTLCDLLRVWRVRGAQAAVARRQFLRQQLAPLAIAAAPGGLLALAFVMRNVGRGLIWRRGDVLIRRLVEFQALVSFDRREVFLAAGYLWLLVAAVVALVAGKARRREWQTLDGFLLCAAGVVGLYFALPARLAGDGFVNVRVTIFVPVLLTLWCAGAPAVHRLRAVIVPSCAALSLALLWLHAGAYARFATELEEYHQAVPHLRPGATVLSLSFAEESGANQLRQLRKVHPFAHAAGYLAARGEVVDLANYQADQGYFPVVYRPEVDPYRFLGGNPEPQGSVGDMSLLRYERATGRRVDYVILWDLKGQTRRRPAQRRLLDELAASYDLAYTSTPGGRMQLYRHRP